MKLWPVHQLLLRRPAPPALRARQHFHHFLPGVSQKHSLMPTRYCKWVTVSGVSGGCSTDNASVWLEAPPGSRVALAIELLASDPPKLLSFSGG